MKTRELPASHISMIFIMILSFHFLPLDGQESKHDTLTNDRVKEIQSSLDRDRFSAQCWWYGWLGAYSAATIGQGAVCLTSDSRSLRQDMALGSVTTFLGAVGQIITPLAIREKKASQYNRQELFSDLAEREKAGRSWKVHAVTGAVNLGSGLITWLGFKRSFHDGVENFLISTAITEAQIWTQPVRATRDYEKYYHDKPGPDARLNRITAEYFFCLYPGGVSFNVRF